MKSRPLTCCFVLVLGLLAAAFGSIEADGTRPPEMKKISVVFMGNSIIQSWSRFSPGFFEDNNYINRGISGQTTPQMLARFGEDVIRLKPDVVVILAGTNDIAGNTGFAPTGMIMDNIISMAELSVANEIKVVLCSVLPAEDYPWNPGQNPVERIPELNGVIEASVATWMDCTMLSTNGKSMP